MRPTNQPSTLLGEAHEYLITQFADDAGKKGGGFCPPKQEEQGCGRQMRLPVRTGQPAGPISLNVLPCPATSSLVRDRAISRVTGSEKC